MRFFGQRMLVGAGFVFAASCATRAVPDRFPAQSAAALEAPAAAPAPVTTSLDEDPPLPGESTAGWRGLQESRDEMEDAGHDHDMHGHGHHPGGHGGHEGHGGDDDVVDVDETPPAPVEGDPKPDHDHSRHGEQP